jgi:hypothetical protein
MSKKSPLFLDGNISLDEALPNKKYKVHGIAIHGDITTEHPGEMFDKRNYILERLKKAVPSLVGKTFLLDHAQPLDGCKVTVSYWNEKENGLYYEGEVSETVANMIKDRQIKGVSISVNPWIKGGGVEWVNGVAPFGFEYDELSFIKNMTPADSKAWVELMEAWQKRFEITPDHLAAMKQAVMKDPPKQWNESKWQHEVAEYKEMLRRRQHEREEESPLDKFRRCTKR